MRRSDIELLRWVCRSCRRAPSRPARPDPTLCDPRLADIGITLLAPRTYDEDQVRERIGVWNTAVFRLARGLSRRAFLALPGRLVRVLGAMVANHDRFDLRAPRLANWAELGISAMVTAILLEVRYGMTDVTVDVDTPNGAEFVRSWLARSRHAGAHHSEADGSAPPSTLVVPVNVVADGTSYDAHVLIEPTAITHPPASHPDETELLRARGERLAATTTTLPVIVPCARTSARILDRMAERAVMTFTQVPDSGYLGVGRGGIPFHLESGHLVIRGPYQRGIDMNELLFEDAQVEISCRLGHVSMSARQVLELEPGEVIAFDAPVGAPVDVMCGNQVIAQGELLDVDGAMGVRILRVYERG